MTLSTSNLTTPTNLILAALPTDEYARLLPHLEEVELRVGEVLSEPDEMMKYVYFPHHSVLSVIAIMMDGSEIEVGVIGKEGMSGLPIIFGTGSTPLQIIVQVADNASRIKAATFKEHLQLSSEFHKLLLRYGHSFFIQTAQTSACNRLHSLDKRLVRWLLMCHDRSQSNTLPLTHEFLSIMLGVRRAGVTVALNKLAADQLIRPKRGFVRIIDRPGLESAACECYQVVRNEFARLSHP
jgi:CRP-like cAMP-binding protein